MRRSRYHRHPVATGDGQGGDRLGRTRRDIQIQWRWRDKELFWGAERLERVRELLMAQ